MNIAAAAVAKKAAEANALGADPKPPDGPKPSKEKRPTGWWRTGIASSKQQSQHKALGIVTLSQTFTLEAKRKQRDELRQKRSEEKANAARLQAEETVARAERIRACTIAENQKKKDHESKQRNMDNLGAIAEQRMKDAMAKVLETDLQGDGPAVTRKAMEKRKRMQKLQEVAFAKKESKFKLAFQMHQAAGSPSEKSKASTPTEAARRGSIDYEDMALVGPAAGLLPAVSEKKENDPASRRNSITNRRSLTISGREIEELNAEQGGGTMADVESIVGHLHRTFNTSLLVIGQRIERAGTAIKEASGAEKAKSPQGLAHIAAVVQSLSEINVQLGSMLKAFSPEYRVSPEAMAPDTPEEGLATCRFMLSKFISNFNVLSPQLKQHVKSGISFEESQKVVRLQDLRDMDNNCTDVVDAVDKFMNYMRSTSIASAVSAVQAAMRWKRKALKKKAGGLPTLATGSAAAAAASTAEATATGAEETRPAETANA